MKKNLQSTLILIVTISLFSCNQIPKEEQEFDALMQTIINVHDEVMPRMGEMSSLIKEITPKVDTTATGKSYTKAQNDLKNSYDFMMIWMNDFGNKFPHNEDIKFDNKEIFEAKMKLLKEEEIGINKIKDHINTSIDNAKKLLEQS